MAVSPSGAGRELRQGEAKERGKTQPLQPGGPLGQPCSGGPNYPHPQLSPMVAQALPLSQSRPPQPALHWQ